MAFKIAEDEAFETIKKILNKRDGNEENIIKKGLKKAAEMFNILTDLKLEAVCLTPHRKLSELQESLGSTT
jgi:cytidylate kinase